MKITSAVCRSLVRAAAARAIIVENETLNVCYQPADQDADYTIGLVKNGDWTLIIGNAVVLLFF
ncbi:MAG TPA: hypothetical protein DDZ90_18250 [Planctomycetaceae bacterium]|nr:hypothetical protein [Gimesia sp.]HBL45325.1 hypothetical protein [Planctomycetaceae bacterium]